MQTLSNCNRTFVISQCLLPKIWSLILVFFCHIFCVLRRTFDSKPKYQCMRVSKRMWMMHDDSSVGRSNDNDDNNNIPYGCYDSKNSLSCVQSVFICLPTQYFCVCSLCRYLQRCCFASIQNICVRFSLHLRINETKVQRKANIIFSVSFSVVNETIRFSMWWNYIIIFLYNSIWPLWTLQNSELKHKHKKYCFIFLVHWTKKKNNGGIIAGGK